MFVVLGVAGFERTYSPMHVLPKDNQLVWLYVDTCVLLCVCLYIRTCIVLHDLHVSCVYAYICMCIIL